MSEHSLAEQDEIMVGGLCPQAENVAECEEQLPNFWESIAVVLWPAYYSPEVHMSQLLLLGKFEYGGGPIFKVVLEC